MRIQSVLSGFPFRSISRHKFFSAVVILVLALGTGVNTALLSAIYRQYQSLPYPNPDRLVGLFEENSEGARQGVALANLLDWRSAPESFEDMGVYRLQSFALQNGRSGESGPSVIFVSMAGSGFLPVLGVEPAYGRFFDEREEIAEEPVIVLTHSLWRDSFRSDPGILGQAVSLNEQSYTVVGILPADFVFLVEGRAPDAYIPIKRSLYGNSRSLRTLQAVARLKSGVSFARARNELKARAAALATSFADSNKGMKADFESLDNRLRGSTRHPLLLAMAAGAVVLLIALSNVINLVLERSQQRWQEIAVRRSLGAQSSTLALAFFMESALLSGAGALLGFAGAGLILGRLPLILSRFGAASTTGWPLNVMDGVTFGLSLALGLIMALILTLAQVLAVGHQDLTESLRPGRTSGVSSGRMRNLLVVSQVALSLVLVFASGLLFRSLLHLRNIDPGFQSGQVVKFGIGLPEVRYDTEQKLAQFHRQLLDKLEQLPGVLLAGGIFRLPFADSLTASFEWRGTQMPETQRLRSAINIVSPGYFHTMRVPLLQGRDLSWHDDLESPRVVLINDAFRRSFLGDNKAVGRRLELSWWSEANPGETEWEIVGVVGDVRQRGLEAAAQAEIYLPVAQFPPEGFVYTLLTSRRDAPFLELVESAIQDLDSGLEKIRISSLDDRVWESLGEQRRSIWLASSLAALALLLTGIGIYAVVAYGVRLRQREIGIRSALGADRARLLRMLFWESLQLAAAGTVIGCLGAWAAGRLLSAQLYGVTAFDPLTLLAAGTVILIVVFLATLIPALRASRIDPCESLKQQDA